MRHLFTITLLLTASIMIGQTTIKETKTSIIINDIEVVKGSNSFTNLFELKYQPNKEDVNLSHFKHAFKVVHVYNNVTIIKILNGSYYRAHNTLEHLRQANPTHTIKFIH